MGRGTKTKSPTRERRPRPSLQRSLALAMMAVATLSVVVCLVIFNVYVRMHLVKQHEQAGDLLAEMVAASLTGWNPDEWRQTHLELIESLRRHPRVAFFGLTDEYDKPLFTGIFDGEAWGSYLKGQGIGINKAEELPKMSSTVDLDAGLVVGTAEIHERASNLVMGDPDWYEPKVQGGVIIGLHDEGIQRTLLSVMLAQLVAVGVVCLACAPVVRWLMRKWNGPLRELLKATQRLADGLPPKPVGLTTNDEMGFLAAAFNDMAGKLMASRTSLMQANTSLEQKVKERTDELQQAVRKLDTMASTDPLTGLANRRAFTEALDLCFRELVRRKNEMACVMIDLDGFKDINDTLGHDTGDELLGLAARVLKENCRSSDVIARLGGDEFVILMPQTDDETAQQVGRRILDCFEQETAQILAEADVQFNVSMSVGLALRKRHNPESSEQLVIQADKAMYSAKGSGKACLRIYDQSLAA